MKKYFTCLFHIFFITGTALAQSSFLDASFGNGGIVITPQPNATVYSSGNFTSVAVQSDNKIVAGGLSDEYIIIARFNENGTLDSTFAINGIFMGGPVYSRLNAMILQPDGKILGVGGALVIRLNSDGSLDNTFGSGGVDTIFANDYFDCYALALQPDGKIVVTGPLNDTYAGVVRLSPNGAPDSTFATYGLYTSPYYGSKSYSVSIMPDGKIVTGGVSFTYLFMAMRFLPDGTADTSFNHTGMVTSGVGDSYNICNALQLQPDGKIVLVGSGDFGATGIDFALIRYNTDGTLDRTFGDTGVVNIDFNENEDDATALFLSSDGKFVIAEYAIVNASENFALSRINSNGNIDSGFGINRRITTSIQDSNDRALAITEQPDGKILLTGWSYNSARIGVGHDPTMVRYMNTSVAVTQLINNEDNIVLCPNPSRGNLNIKGIVSHIISVTACDAEGNHIPINIDLANHEIFTDNIADGIYFFKISYDDHPPDVQKIIIQNR